MSLSDSFKNPPRFIRTLWHLKARQIFHRVRLNLLERTRRFVPGMAVVSGRGPLPDTMREPRVLLSVLETRFPENTRNAQPGDVERILSGNIEFLNRSLPFSAPGAAWNPEGASRLWRYHLHYFDYGFELALRWKSGKDDSLLETVAALMEDWIDQNAPFSRPGWEPYPLSLRLVNWTQTMVLLHPIAGERAAFREKALNSMALQARHLARNIEYHIMGNHLVKNAKALIWCGAFFEGEEAEEWLIKGTRLLLEELDEQILPDGGHFERSPGYHLSVFEDALDCLCLLRSLNDPRFSAGDEERLAGVAHRMRRWLRAILLPGGTLPVFNDTVAKPRPSPEEVLAYSAKILDEEISGDEASIREDGITELQESGYYILRDGRGAMTLDCGEIGPDYLGAHAHCDTLSYEWFLGEEPVIVNSGTWEYEEGSLREYFRSTRAHNTLEIDGIDQSETWKSHRVGRRARPLEAKAESKDDVLTFTGAHDGYRRIGATHRRRIVAVHGTWIVLDECAGRGRHRARSFVHPHPDLPFSESGGCIVLGKKQVILTPLFGAVFGMEKGWYSPDWGIAVESTILCLEEEGEAPFLLGYVISPADAGKIEIACRQNPRGIVLEGYIGGQPVSVVSE